MEMIIFIGIQGSGKSSFYKERFYSTHVRINRDMLKTKHREKRLFETCLEIGQPFVIDNTNVTRVERAVYISAARLSGFRITGYYFIATTREAIARNARRTGRARIPVVGILGTYKRLEAPVKGEGFDELFHVTLKEDGEFVVNASSEAVPPS